MTAEIKSPAETASWVGRWCTPGRFGLLLAALLFAFYPGVVLGTRSFVDRDYGVLGYPFVFHLRQCLLNGEWPMWNPLSNCGAPFLAQWGTMALYPVSLFFILFPLPWSLGVFCLAHLWLAGLGMYYLARRWVQHPLAAALAGLAFVFNGATLSALIWPNYTVALGWMPWILLLAEQGCRDGGRPWLLAVLVSALQILAGVPEITVMTWLIVLPVCAAAFYRHPNLRLKIAARAMAMVVFASALVAVQLLPTLDLLLHSQRHAGFATAKWSMPGWGWANYLVPLFHYYQNYQGHFFQTGQSFVATYYLGLGLLALAILGAWRARSAHSGILTVICLFAWIMALGPNGYLYPALRQTLPFLGVARYPIKFVYLNAFAAPLLAAFGLRWWLAHGAAAKAWTVLVSIGSMLILLSAGILWFGHQYPFPLDQWSLTRTDAFTRLVFMGATLGVLAALTSTRKAGLQMTLAGLLLLLQVGDIRSHAPWQNPTIPSGAFLPVPAQMLPQIKPGAGRVMISPAAEEKLLRSTVPDYASDFIGKRLALWSNLNLMEGVPKVGGSSTLQLKEQAEVQTLLYAATNRDLSPLMDFLGVSHITHPTNVTQWIIRTNCLPLFTAGQRPVFMESNQILTALAQPEFNPRKVVYLPLEARAAAEHARETAARIEKVDVQASRIALEVKATDPAMLVVAQSYYHPWQAWVDGQPVPILRANHAFQAIVLPAKSGGMCWVELGYRDRRFSAGAAISGTALLVWLWLYRKKSTAASVAAT